MSTPRERNKEDWARLALARIGTAHDAIVSAAGDVGTPRPLETATHLLEAADKVLREWITVAFPSRH
jgi:hypothetical protein